MESTNERTTHGEVTTMTGTTGNSTNSTFENMETLRRFLDENGDLMNLAMRTAKASDEDAYDIHKAGTFHGVCLAIATMSQVPVNLVEEIICEFADIDY